MKDEAQVRHCYSVGLYIHQTNFVFQYLVENHKLLLDSIDSELKPLLCCHVHQLYLTLRPASVALSWNIKQSKWGRFFNQCRKSMVKFKLLCQRLEDIRINQLERVLDSLRYFTLCPESGRDKIWILEEFIEAVKDACRKATSVIEIGIKLRLTSLVLTYFSPIINRKSSREIGSWRMEFSSLSTLSE